MTVMNTAPRDDLEVNDEVPTATQVRDRERQRAAVEIQSRVLVARHRATGEWVGYHDVHWSPAAPTATEIRTGNADSNDAMLGINRAMGYQPFISMALWELRVETAQRWLAARGRSQSG